MKRGRAVQMFLPPRAAWLGLALLALPLAAAPAQGATLESVLAEARSVAIESWQWIEELALRVWAGDADAIRDGAYGFAGLVALVGLWLLVRPPWTHPAESVIALPDGQGVVETANPAPAVKDDPEDGPPAMRLLEAVAAAKAQFAISEAERKRRAP